MKPPNTSISFRPLDRRRIEDLRSYLVTRQGPGTTITTAAAVRWALRLAARHVKREVRTRRRRRRQENDT